MALAVACMTQCYHLVRTGRAQFTDPPKNIGEPSSCYRSKVQSASTHKPECGWHLQLLQTLIEILSGFAEVLIAGTKAEYCIPESQLRCLRMCRNR